MALDPLFGLHSAALAVQKQRMDVLAGNLANSDTPNFKARDIDFAATLQAQLNGGAQNNTLQKTQSTHLDAQASAGDSLDGLVWRVPVQGSVDGNTVDTQIEQSKFADAALHYQASLNFIDGRVKGMLTAITGQ